MGPIVMNWVEAVINFRLSDTKFKFRCCRFLRTQTIFILPKYEMPAIYSGIQIEDEMSGAHSTHGKNEKCVNKFW